jgi:hypothetical protein
MHRTTATILGINLGLLLLLAVVALARQPSHNLSMAGFALFWYLIPLWLLNGLAWFISLFKLPESRPYFMGFLLAGILLPIIGLGACGLSVVAPNNTF